MNGSFLILNELKKAEKKLGFECGVNVKGERWLLDWLVGSLVDGEKKLFWNEGRGEKELRGNW